RRSGTASPPATGRGLHPRRTRLPMKRTLPPEPAATNAASTRASAASVILPLGLAHPDARRKTLKGSAREFKPHRVPYFLARSQQGLTGSLTSPASIGRTRSEGGEGMALTTKLAVAAAGLVLAAGSGAAYAAGGGRSASQTTTTGSTATTATAAHHHCNR